jgi:hypothetical protein
VFAPKPRDDLTACRYCQRNFAEDRVEKHEEICLKTSQKKRKVFDMTKTRVKVGLIRVPFASLFSHFHYHGNEFDRQGSDAEKFVKSSAQLKAMEAKVSLELKC